MKSNNHKLFTLATLMAGATAILHLSNRFIESNSQVKNLLSESSSNFYISRLGRIYYKKTGNGTPLVLIHDLLPGASGYEWNHIEEQLASNHTVYTLDLLGCGRSEKAGITYTNFVYVELISSFIKDVIKEKTDIITSGFSGSFAIMTALHDQEIINRIVLINPPSLNALTQETKDQEKLLSRILQVPIFGTFIYHIAVSREISSNLFLEKLYYNPFHADETVMDAYYEASHKGGYYAKYLYISMICKYMNVDITNALKTINNSIYIVSGDKETNSENIAKEYQKINPSIEIAAIENAKHLPHIETSEKFMEQLQIFFEQVEI